jgi:hypothetical protein
LTLTELNEAVRALVPKDVTTFVELKVGTYGHRPFDVDVEVSISAQHHGMCKIVEAPTASEALDLFKIKTLPFLGLSEKRPAMERLAEMEPKT